MQLYRNRSRESRKEEKVGRLKSRTLGIAIAIGKYTKIGVEEYSQAKTIHS